MKKLYLALLILIPCLLQAQREKPIRNPDSAGVYQRQLNELYRAAIDSMRNSEAYLTALENYNRVLRKQKGYTSFTILLDALHSDYGQFNEMLAQEGFPALEETTLRIGFGTSFKVNRTMVDFYYMAVGLNSKSEKGDEKITAGLSNLLHVDIGYNLLKSQRFSIYPYGGLSLRLSNIRYTKKPVENPDFTSITNMLIGGENINLSSTRIGYQLGIGFDVPLTFNKEKSSAIFPFVKFGINRPLWKDKYQHADLPKYNTGIKQGIWHITLGFKIAGIH